jgi:hypothetical protein
MTDTPDQSMAMTGDPDDALLARYLMGACSEDEKAHVEEHLFARDAVFERLCAVEEELIGRRVRGQLTAEDRDRFDRAYAEPPRRDRVLFARALTTVLSDEPAAEAGAESTAGENRPRISRWALFWHGSGFRIASATAAVILLAGLALVSWRANELRSTLASIQADNAALRQQREADHQRVADLEKRAAAVTNELDRERAGRASIEAARAAPGRIVTFALSSGLLRSARAPARLLLRPSTSELRLQLDLEPGIDGGRLRAELRDANARVLWSQDILRPAQATRQDADAAVSITLPAAIFRDGEYEVVLFSTADGRQFDETARYYFDVVKR